jgi:hypothetical protein
MSSPNGASKLVNSELLKEVVETAFVKILDRARSRRPMASVPGQKIGTHLYLIALQLFGVNQLFQFPVATEKLSRRALQDLLKIFKVRSPSAWLIFSLD